MIRRPLRSEFPNTLYHVTSRGNHCEAIFEDDNGRIRFCLWLPWPLALVMALQSCMRGRRQTKPLWAGVLLISVAWGALVRPYTVVMVPQSAIELAKCFEDFEKRVKRGMEIVAVPYVCVRQDSGRLVTATFVRYVRVLPSAGHRTGALAGRHRRLHIRHQGGSPTGIHAA